MLKPIKITEPDHNVFMVSDLHWRHNRAFIYEPRGFKSVQEHDDTLIHRWNEVVRPDSIVFHLGDIIFNDSEGSELRALFRRLTFGTLYLMPGNHFSGWLKVYKDLLSERFPDAVVDGRLAYEIYPLTLDLGHKKVIFVTNYLEAHINKDMFVMCHYALAAHNGQSKGSYMIAAHSHGNLPLTNKDKGQGRRLDVGIESFGRPISISDIKRHLAGRELDVRDHHGRAEESS